MSSDFYGDHYFLSGRNRGGAKQLVGDVVVVVFFLNDKESHWTESAKEEYKQATNEAVYFLNQEAEKRGINLLLRTAYGELNSKRICVGSSDDDWRNEAISAYQRGDITDYQEYYADHFKIDEAPIIFALNKCTRSGAATATRFYPHADESCFVGRDVYNGKFNLHTIVHELLHLFGAHDLYFPKNVEKYASMYLPNSIMSTGYTIDGLTEYVIGWTSSISEAAAYFLLCTKDIPREKIEEAIRNEWKK